MFWGMEQVGGEQIEQETVVLVLPYEMVSPLPKYFRILIMKDSTDTLEVDLLKTILNDLPSQPPTPPRLPTPVNSLVPSDPPPRPNTIFDLDPHTCLRLEAYCLEHNIDFVRLSG